jgi:acetoin utilization protein AcuB
MKIIPAIKSVMTPFPYSVEVSAPIREAQEFMRKHNIRHLPVTENQKLVGVLTDRDIKLFLGPEFGYPDQKEITVKDVYMEHPYIVDLNERLDKVLKTMAMKHIGSVLVTRNGKLAGVFTSTDACESFAEFLRDHFRPPGGNEAA